MIINKKVMAVGIFVFTAILAAPVFKGRLFAERNAGQAVAVLQSGELPPSLNLHYTGKYCDQCHDKKPSEGGPAFLKFGGDYGKLCGHCHDNTLGSYLHPVDIVPSDEKKAKMPGELPLNNGKVTCSTCHDLFLQCRESPSKLSSLRGAPYAKRTDFCFKCHAEQNYPMLNPHEQLKPDGVVMAERCLNCHVQKPDVQKADARTARLSGTVNDVCRKCHVISLQHSGDYMHFVKPSLNTLAYMKSSEKKFGIILPLDEKGKITCVTCHNPHQQGVIPPDRPSAKGAGSKLRHRLPGKICAACHKMY